MAGPKRIKKSGATASLIGFVLSLISVAGLIVIPFASFASAPGLVFSIIGLVRSKKAKESLTLSIVGIVINGIIAVASIVVTVLLSYAILNCLQDMPACD